MRWVKGLGPLGASVRVSLYDTERLMGLTSFQGPGVQEFLPSPYYMSNKRLQLNAIMSCRGRADGLEKTVVGYHFKTRNYRDVSI